MMLVRIPVPTLIRRMVMEVEMEAVHHIRSEMEAYRRMESVRRLIVLMIDLRLEGDPMRVAASPIQLKCRGMSIENRN